MSLKVGTKKVSPMQLDLLENVKLSSNIEFIAETLEEVVFDRDLISGKETLHPEWIGIYETNKSKLESFLPPKVFKAFTKSFASLDPIDSGVRQLDPNSTRFTFLLGAGASKPEPSGIPTVKELLPDLLNRARRLDRDDVTRLADFCEERGIDNIEDLLTSAQIADFCSRNPAILGIVEFLLYRRKTPAEISVRRLHKASYDRSSVAFLQDTLQILFGLLSNRMLPAKPNKGHEAIVEYVQRFTDLSIITTNYDCCIDLALEEVGKNFTYLIDFANLKSNRTTNINPTKLIKLHGSLNWFYCETCQKVNLINIKKTVSDYLNDLAPYPIIGVCKDCGGQRRGLLVPPLAMKFNIAPPLNPLLDFAQDAFNEAETVVVVGFSFADADLYISRMLSKWMQTSGEGKLIIFDPDINVVDKVRKQFSLRIPSFDESRVLRVIGDCSDNLPKFLSGSLFRKKKSRKPTTRKVNATKVLEDKNTS